MTLRSLLAENTSIAKIAEYLDALTPDERAREGNGLGRSEQARLFEIAADAPRITLAHFVPDDVAPGRAVHHPGRNTISVFEHFQRFEKRFTRPTAERARGLLAGYNASNAWFVHPGYFVAYETSGSRRSPEREASREAWERRGGVVVDYFQVPDGLELPAGWPPVRRNSQGLQRLVYHRTRDFMRRVSSHVSIGRASTEDEKGDRLLDYWFTLVREPPAAERAG